MTILTAIQRIQALALASSSDMKLAPDTPITNAGTLPMSLAHLGGGTSTAMNKTTNLFIPNILVDFYFNASTLSKAIAQIDTIIPAFCNRLAGDPTLNATVDTIVFPVTWDAPATAEMGGIDLLNITVNIPIKTLETPVST